LNEWRLYILSFSPFINQNGEMMIFQGGKESEYLQKT